jgi:quercetin dioxygenase-like cupin family protein
MERLNMLMKAAAQKLSEVPSVRDNGMVEYQLKEGNALAFSLLKKKEVAVADSFLSKGTIFPYHKHSGSKEFLLVYSGNITVVFDCLEDNRRDLMPGDLLELDICIGHVLFAKEDSWVVAVTIPADENFPG